MPIEHDVAHARARSAALARRRPVDDPARIAARRDLAEANLAAYIARVVAGAPPLTSEQIDRLAMLLRPARARESA